MVQILFHGPNDSNECRRVVRKLARELGGKFSYTSFWCGRRGQWHSDDTVGKAAYSVRLDDAKVGSRDDLAKLVRGFRNARLTPELRFVFAHYHKFEGPLAKPGYHEAWSRVHRYSWEE